MLELVTAWLSSDLVEHVLAPECFRDSFGLVLCQRVIGIRACDLKHAIVEHHHAQQPECDAGTDLYLVHVVKTEAARLFNPILDERIAQSVFGVRLGKIRAFDDETIFAHFFGL